MLAANSLEKRLGAETYVQLTNGRIVQGDDIIHQDIWINTISGKICDRPQDATNPSDIRAVDLHGSIVAPGFIDVQINGAFGFDFSNSDCIRNPDRFQRGLRDLNRRLIQTGTTSYLPTMTSQFSHTYHRVRPQD